MTKKIQSNVSENFHEWAERELPEAFRNSLPEDIRKHAPRSLTALLPSALVRFAESMGLTVPVDVMKEAAEAMRRKPGPKKKDDRQTSFVDGKPGVWLSAVQLSTGNAAADAGDARIQFFGLHQLNTCASWAAENNWGAIPEAKDGVPGMRFIPPGAPLIPEAPKPPKPIVTEVGVFVSEEQIKTGPIAILADGRVVPRNIGADGNDKLGADVIRFQHATVPTSMVDLAESTRLNILRDQTNKSFRIANADAVEIGWTVKRETRRGVRGFRYIPPGTKLRFMLPEQEVEME